MKLIEIEKEDLEAIATILFCLACDLNEEEYLDKLGYPEEKREKISKVTYDLIMSLYSRILSEDENDEDDKNGKNEDNINDEDKEIKNKA